MTDVTEIAVKLTKAQPKELLEAIETFCVAVKPHHMDHNQREKIREALIVLIDQVIELAAVSALIEKLAKQTQAPDAEPRTPF